MADLLYLLGAGASSQVLPLASQFSTRLKKFAQELPSLRPPPSAFQNIDSDKWTAIRRQLCKDVIWLAEKASRHLSVDTLAKKLFYLQDLSSLSKLKAIVSTYLLIEQARNNVDMRYDAFLATILKQDEYYRLILPDNLRVMTWNYDSQLEKAFFGFCENTGTVTETITFNKSQIHRINGLCGTNPPGTIGEPFLSQFNSTNEKFKWINAVKLYDEYTNQRNAPDADICFAWEDRTNYRLNQFMDKIQNTTEAVIIGYSFPYFNRTTDKFIFSNLRKLDRIYLQYPQAEVCTSIQTRVRALLSPNLAGTMHFTHIIESNVFYIPDSLI